MRRSVFSCLLLLGLAALGSGFNLFGVDHYVTTTQDHVEGSLREAIIKANTNNSYNRIYIPAGTYVLTGAAGEDSNTGGDLDFDTRDKIVLIGDGAMVTTIDGNQNDRVLHIIRGTVSVHGITLRNGKTSPGSGAPDQLPNRDGEYGGAVFNNGNLNLSSCFITASTTGSGGPCDTGETAGNGGHGGGIYNHSGAELELTDCFVSNTTTGTGGSNYNSEGNCYFGSGGSGGGIYNAGTQILLRCTISANTTGNGGSMDPPGNWGGNGGDGGGIYNSGSQVLTDCYITDNVTGSGLDSQCGTCTVRGGHGGGIFCESGDTTISGSIIRNNSTGSNQTADFDGYGGFGGGIYNNSTLNIYQSSISENLTGNGINAGHGGGIYNEGTLQLSQSSIYQNLTGSSTGPGNGGSGGGIYNINIIQMQNCTVSTNTTGNGGDGGGIFNSGSSCTIDHCTIYSNTTGNDGTAPNHPGSRSGYGAGIYTANPNVRIFNTIIANNNTSQGGLGADCYGTLNSSGYNIIQNTLDCTIEGIDTGNITGLAPMLQDLAQNGGTGPTHALLPGSPALDAGKAVSLSGSALSVDQRGYVRPSDIPGLDNVIDGSDIGAFEAIANLTVSGSVVFNGNGLKNVTLTFTPDSGSTVTNPDGQYSHTVPFGWSGTITPTKEGYTFSPAQIEHTVLTAGVSGQDFIATADLPFLLQVTPNQLHFGADTEGNQTASQYINIDKIGHGDLNWSVTSDASWLSCSPDSGTGPGRPAVSVNPGGLIPGTYNGTLAISDPGASNSPQNVAVVLNVYTAGASQPPTGSFDLPIDGSAVNSSIPVTGWALDDIMVESVKIYRYPGPGEGSAPIFIGNAVLVEGARDDVEAAHPAHPFNNKAGWGYMMLTNGLPGGGNGTYTILATVNDIEGNSLSLGTKTIHCDNASAVKPFGAIDTPLQGGTASGDKYVNFGWVLTPLPNTIPVDGSTIYVHIDGKPAGQTVYNQPRPDIEALFPGYNNSAGPVGYFSFDTTQYANGVHTIQWTVEDDAGNRDGIGSRFFSIYNQSPGKQNPAAVHAVSSAGLSRLATYRGCPPRFYKGNRTQPYIYISAGQKTGKIMEKNIILLEPLEPVKILLLPGIVPGKGPKLTAGGLISGENLEKLPIGSTLDIDEGIFYWQPGPGFYGTFSFVFFLKENHRENCIYLDIRIAHQAVFQ